MMGKNYGINFKEDYMNYDYIIKFPNTMETKKLGDIASGELSFAVINVTKNEPIIEHLNSESKKEILEDLSDIWMHHLEKEAHLKNIVSNLTNLDIIYFSDLIDYKNNFIHIIFYKENTNIN